MVASGIFVSLLVIAVATIANALPTLESRASVTTLTTAEISAYMPYAWYANSAYCAPAKTLAWSCGAYCNANSGFKPVASGGNGGSIQYWYVGYDPSLATVVVGYQGTDASKILPVVTDADFFLDNLDSTLFPGLSSDIKTHNGFAEAHAKSASAVVAGVKKAISTYSAKKVTIVGHSLGGALALIASVHLPLNLPSAISFKTVTFGMPRVGNQEFVDYLNARGSLTRINNQDDIVPIVPGRFLGFHHTNGEIHITDDGAWNSCPGQDNTEDLCTIGYVPNILAGDSSDHHGPYADIFLTSTGCE